MPTVADCIARMGDLCLALVLWAMLFVASIWHVLVAECVNGGILWPVCMYLLWSSVGSSVVSCRSSGAESW